MNEIQQTPAQHFLTSLRKLKGIFTDVIPGNGTAEAFIAQAYIYAKHNPNILNCSEASLINALMCCAQTGLNLNPQGNLAHIVPYKGQAKLIIGYQGYIDLMYRCAGVIDVDAQIVYAGDEFEYERGTRPFIKHRPRWQDLRSDTKGEYIEVREAAYCIITFRNGFKKFEVMHKYQIERIRDSIRHYKKNDPEHMWNKHPDSMWRKTAIRSTVKYVPHTPQLALALDLDRREEDGEPQIIELGDVTKPADPEHEVSRAKKVEDALRSEPADWGVFGATITKARVDAGVSTYKAAELLMLNDEELFNVESGAKYEPRGGDRYTNITKFAEACGLDPAGLLDLMPE